MPFIKTAVYILLVLVAQRLPTALIFTSWPLLLLVGHARNHSRPLYSKQTQTQEITDEIYMVTTATSQSMSSDRREAKQRFRVIKRVAFVTRKRINFGHSTHDEGKTIPIRRRQDIVPTATAPPTAASPTRAARARAQLD